MSGSLDFDLRRADCTLNSDGSSRSRCDRSIGAIPLLCTAGQSRLRETQMVINDGDGKYMKKVVARKNLVLDAAQKNIENWLSSMPHCTVIRGHARFVSPNEIEVRGNRLSVDR